MQKESGDLEPADNESLEAKVIKLKLEYEKLASEKKCEVSDLVRENGFAWSQFKCTESGFTDKLKKKDDEIAQANTKISSLLSYQEQLQSTNQDKDDIISRLKAKVAEMETNSTKKDEEILKLSRELESLKKSRSFTPVLTRCTTTRDKGSNGNTTHISTKKEKSAASTPNDKVTCENLNLCVFSHLAFTEAAAYLILFFLNIWIQDIKSSKRKRVNKTPVSISEVPKLFTSTFRVPKLKSPSSQAI